MRVILAATILMLLGEPASPSQRQYPPLTRETLVGTWECLIDIGTIPVVFHIVIRAQNSESFMSEIYPEHMQGRLFRLETCTVAEGKVTLHFTDSGGDGWWIVGEGYGDADEAWIDGRISIPNKPEAGPPNVRLEKGTWVRQLGEAAARAAEKIPRE